MRMDVWLEAQDAPVGRLERADDKALTFTYSDSATDAERISLSLPVRQEPYSDGACRGYFENLLFEGTPLNSILDSYKLDRDDTGSLLFHLGADCPGAISITPEGIGPGKRPGIFPDEYDQLSDAALSEIIKTLHLYKRLPDESRDPSPLAGVQGKIALVVREGQYWLPKAKTRAPTSHILKVSPHDDPMLTKYECALLAAAGASGLRTTVFDACEFKIDHLTINAILVSRFDRNVQPDGIYRIHAEDLCQALGLAPRLKYERKSESAEHRFSAAAVGSVARQMSAPGLFLQQFLDETLFNLLVGNTDNHGKNTSILHRNKSIELAPLYDVVPVFMDRTVTHQLAFDIGAAQFAEDVTQDNLLQMMAALGYRRPRIDKPVEARLRSFVTAITDIGMAQGGKRLADGLAAQMEVVADALNLALGVPERDYFQRAVRDEGLSRTGWDAGS